MGAAGAPQGYASVGVPVIPGWDGVAVSTLPVQVEFEMRGHWTLGGLSTSVELLLNSIIAQNIAGAGYTLAAVFLPVMSQGKQKGQPLDMKPVGLRTLLARAMCIFQKDQHVENLQVETLFLRANMEVKVNMWSSSAVEVEGYQGLYTALGQAGVFELP